MSPSGCIPFGYIVIRGGRLSQPPVYRKTGYPLPVQSTVSSSAAWVEKLWDISLRTLKNCMMETYMDCPYYEHLQYIMDTRLQMLFTYAVSNDTGLVKKALLDFHCGMQPGGLLTGKAPARGKLPVLLPADMETVETHCEDRADDITPYTDSCGNIYHIGFGLG